MKCIDMNKNTNNTIEEWQYDNLYVDTTQTWDNFKFNPSVMQCHIIMFIALLSGYYVRIHSYHGLDCDVLVLSL